MLNKAVFALAVLSSAASAETLTCPVGGEQFEAPQAALCDGITGLPTMLLAPSRCTPAPMPQCPQNFLPMYRDFTAEELPILRQFMQSESYESNVDFSPYYLAYIVEKYLNGANAALPAQVLLQGLWQDPALIFEDQAYMGALKSELEAQFQPATKDQNALLLGMLAFVEWLGENPADAAIYIARAEGQSARDLTVQNYLTAVQACFTDKNLSFCTATALIPQP